MSKQIVSAEDISPYIPASVVPFVTQLINHTGVDLRLKNKLKNKLGDYRAPYNGTGHRITVNNDLNQYQFLITLLHEFAHLLNWNKHESKVKSHGEEWKQEFKTILNNDVVKDCFPDDIKEALDKHLLKLRSSCSLDIELQRVFFNYDESSSKVFIADLSNGMTFAIDNGREFLVIKKLRKRLKCREISSNRIYLFNPAHAVNLV